MNTEYVRKNATKKALPKIRLLKNTASLGVLGAEGVYTTACKTGPTCLGTQVGCASVYCPPHN
jgi:hypothetical protein